MTLPQSGKTWARDAETWEEEEKLQKELHGSSGWVPTSTHLTRLPRVFTQCQEPRASSSLNWTGQNGLESLSFGEASGGI